MRVARHRQLWQMVFGLLVQIALRAACAAQAPARLISTAIDTARVQVLANHHPLWANPANDLGPLPSSQDLESLTLVLNRAPAQKAALEQFLAAQQDPSSPEYHHWLTSAEFGQRFGPADADLAALTGWLQSQGLHVNWVSPSKVLVGFGGTAADVSHAFGTSIHLYRVHGLTRMSVSSSPTIPRAVAPAVRAIQGLYSIDALPQHVSSALTAEAPALTTTSGAHFLSPGDFAAIYDLPSGLSGAGQTIAILGRARINSADLDNFKAVLGVSFANPTVVVPTAYGGADPGPPLTAPPPSNISTADQGEATLDVVRAGSVAPAANLLLVVATQGSGGLDADAEYVVNTTPVPAHVMSISFGACELEAGPSGVSFWNSLFQQAAAEGISTFVSSGDSGAAGCDVAFTAPPASTYADSPNYICSSPYATCVGGTQFNDPNSSLYWEDDSGALGTTATGYIPEGGWNESWNGSTATVAASGGGVSQYLAIPSWQRSMPGVPAAHAGRYTPDLSFSAAQHDGYFACFAADGGSCVSSGGNITFNIFGGTSASAPGMAGIAALLDQSLGGAQGDLNPGIYQMSRSAPTAFHDITVTSSGVASCSASVPSTCNSSVPGQSGLSGTQAGYLVGNGYDEVTGLGSLDAARFIAAWPTASSVFTPVVSANALTVPVNQDIWIGVNVAGAPDSSEPSGSVVLTAGSYTSAQTPLLNGFVYIVIPAGKLPQGAYAVGLAYTPDSASSAIYRAASGTAQLTVSAPQYIKPVINLSPSASVITSTEPVTLTVSVRGSSTGPAPTGTVSLASGSYVSGPAVLFPDSNSVAEAVLQIAPGALPTGSNTVAVTYSPAAAAASVYLNSAAAVTITNEGARITPIVSVPTASLQSTTAQTLTIPILVDGYAGNPLPTGTVAVSASGRTFPATVLAAGSAVATIPAGVLPVGYDTLLVSYTPDTQSAATYRGASAAATATVSLAQKILPAVSVTRTTAEPSAVAPLAFSIAVSGGPGNPTPAGSVQVAEPNYPPGRAVLSGGAAVVTLPPGAFSGGTDTFAVTYTPAADSPLYYSAASVAVTAEVAKAASAMTVTASGSTLTTLQALTLDVALAGAPGGLLPTGQLQLTSAAYSPIPIPVQGGSTIITIPAGELPPGHDTLTVTYPGDAAYTGAATAIAIDVTMPSTASFGVDAGSLAVTKGSTSGNYSAVRVTPLNGFTGAVSLSAAIISTPAHASNLPVLSFSPSSTLELTGLQPGTARLVIGTAGSTSTAQSASPLRWTWGGSAALACLFFLVPVRRRRWAGLLGLVVLMAVLLSGVSACGGSPASIVNDNSGNGGASSGTTPGQYVIALTATSGTLSASKTITVTVQ